MRLYIRSFHWKHLLNIVLQQSDRFYYRRRSMHRLSFILISIFSTFTHNIQYTHHTYMWHIRAHTYANNIVSLAFIFFQTLCLKILMLKSIRSHINKILYKLLLLIKNLIINVRIERNKTKKEKEYSNLNGFWSKSHTNRKNL